MSVDIEQWRAEIGTFNECSQLSVVTLYLNMRNLISNMFIVLICTISLPVCYIKFYVFSYLTNGLSFSVLMFFLHVLGSTFCSRFCSLRERSFTHIPFIHYLYTITFTYVLFSSYFMHILFLQHGDIETNLEPTKHKFKIFLDVIGVLTV